ncbi:hypothetical protein K8I61_04895 [bacterium]|nr:hypothetical protein [bacterium]
MAADSACREHAGRGKRNERVSPTTPPARRDTTNPDTGDVTIRGTIYSEEIAELEVTRDVWPDKKDSNANSSPFDTG